MDPSFKNHDHLTSARTSSNLNQPSTRFSHPIQTHNYISAPLQYQNHYSHHVKPKTNYVTSSHSPIPSSPYPSHSQVFHPTTTIQKQIPQNMATITQPRPPESKLQYVPYENYYIDYEEQQVMTTVMVPVQRKCLNYYAVERVTQYLPKQRQQTFVEMVPEEKINMRLAYVPVQTKIVHYPKGDGTYGTTVQVLNEEKYSKNPEMKSSYHHHQPNYRSPIQMSRKTNRVLPRTNYVTTDNYVPSDYEAFEEQREERFGPLSNNNQSQFRQSRRSDVYEQK